MERPLKICQITDGSNTYPPLGAETRSWETHRIAQGLSQLGCEVDVVLLARPTAEKYVYRLTNFGPFVAKNKYVNKAIFGASIFTEFRKYAVRRHFDIIHYHSTIAATAGKLGLGDSVPSVITVGDPFFGGMHEPKNYADILRLEHPRALLQRRISLSIASFAYRRVNAIISVSQILKERIASMFGIPSRSISVIPPEVDLKRFRPGLETRILREEWKISLGTKVVMCPARITPLKSQIDLIRALPEVTKSFKLLKLFLVGHVTNKAYMKTLIRSADSLGVCQNVIVTGSVSAERFPMYYNLADIIVLPSVGEGLPSSLIEAMSCGKAIVASDIPPNREVVKTGSEAVFFRPHASEKLAEHIVSLLQNEELRMRMGKAGRETALNYYNWKRIAEMTLQLYKKII